MTPTDPTLPATTDADLDAIVRMACVALNCAQFAVERGDVDAFRRAAHKHRQLAHRFRRAAAARERQVKKQTTALDPNQPWSFGAKPIKKTTDDLPEATW